MKFFFIIICSFYFSVAYCQEQKVYIFYVELNDFSQAPKFNYREKILKYAGVDEKEQSFFSKYTILDFFQAYPDSNRKRTLNMFMVATPNEGLMIDMLRSFPDKYLRIEDLTGLKTELTETYLNDYGTTSPLVNNGVASLKSFDYINVPKAWDYSVGSVDIKIGISDAKIDTTDIDFKFKTTFQQAYYDAGLHTLPYNSGSSARHGTSIAAIAAAQGNNSHGAVGICSECQIVATPFSYGNPGTYTNPNPNFNNLLQLAKSGVKVINMSWRLGRFSPMPVQNSMQWIFDEIHDDYNVVLVAAAGNENPNDINYITYPASFNHVISVSSINHKNSWNEEVVLDANYGTISRFVADQIAPSVAFVNGGVIGWPSHTINKDVDICAPGFQYLLYSRYVGEGAIAYGDGTSGAAPHVSGTIGLMYSINNCLINDEVEDILQLSSKNVETILGNEPYVGKIGSGKLETGDAVKFVYEMMQPTGNAVIDGQDFYRFNFDLKHINNKLTISNQKFRDNCTADFTAKKIIEIMPGTDFNPNNIGFVDMKIDSLIDITCTEKPSTKSNRRNSLQKEAIGFETKLYPNPNNGNFEITLSKEIKSAVNVDIYDLYGKVIYSDVKTKSSFGVSLPNISTGIYIIKISSPEYNETIKFIKE